MDDRMDDRDTRYGRFVVKDSMKQLRPHASHSKDRYVGKPVLGLAHRMVVGDTTITADMRTETAPARNTGLSATTTLVALVAMATTCSAAIVAVPRSVHVSIESRALMIESQSVRHVAAAVAAIARDLLGKDKVEQTLAELPWTDQYLPMIEARPATVEAEPIITGLPIIEQLLDLPPPTC